MTINYNCDPCTDPQCETLMLTDDKLYKRFLIRILCAMKGLLGGGGPAGYATEGTLQAIDAKITACDTGNVVVTAMPAGTSDATAANQVLEIAELTSIDGKITACNTGAVTVSVSALPAGAATEATLSSLNGKVTACNTGAVTVAASALPAGAATEVTLSALNGKVTACDTGSIAGTVTANIQGYNGTNNHPIRIDSATRTIQMIDYEHHEIHAGSSFTCHYSNDCTNIGEMTMIAFKTSNTTKWIHVVFEASSTAGSYMAIYENSDLDVDEGTDLTIYNRDRNSGTAATVQTIETIPEVGKATSYNEAQAAGATLDTTTEILRWYLGAATVGADQAGLNRGSHEFILKQNTEYAFVVVSTSADDNTHNIQLNWYEHTNQAV